MMKQNQALQSRTGTGLRTGYTQTESVLHQQVWLCIYSRSKIDLFASWLVTLCAGPLELRGVSNNAAFVQLLSIMGTCTVADWISHLIFTPATSPQPSIIQSTPDIHTRYKSLLPDHSVVACLFCTINLATPQQQAISTYIYRLHHLWCVPTNHLVGIV